jgi:hypothetical protein
MESKIGVDDYKTQGIERENIRQIAVSDYQQQPTVAIAVPRTPLDKMLLNSSCMRKKLKIASGALHALGLILHEKEAQNSSLDHSYTESSGSKN